MVSYGLLSRDLLQRRDSSSSLFQSIEQGSVGNHPWTERRSPGLASIRQFGPFGDESIPQSVDIIRQSGRAGQLQRNGFILDHQLGDLPETGNFIQLQLS